MHAVYLTTVLCTMRLLW